MTWHYLQVLCKMSKKIVLVIHFHQHVLEKIGDQPQLHQSVSKNAMSLDAP